MNIHITVFRVTTYLLLNNDESHAYKTCVCTHKYIYIYLMYTCIHSVHYQHNFGCELKLLFSFLTSPPLRLNYLPDLVIINNIVLVNCSGNFTYHPAVPFLVEFRKSIRRHWHLLPFTRSVLHFLLRQHSNLLRVAGPFNRKILIPISEIRRCKKRKTDDI
jgi:hypothetical protein